MTQNISDNAGESIEALEYQVVELALVTDEELTRVLNEYTALGWHYQGTQFAMRESSRRPAMAFVTFTRRGA